MKSRTWTKQRKIGISIALTIAIFIIDLLTVREYSYWALYIIPLLFAVPAVTRPYIPFFPLGGTILIGLDFLWSPGEISSLATINRLLGIFTLWAALPLLVRQKKAEEALEQSYRELEQRVEDRTAELRQANTSLKSEIDERKRAEEVARESEVRLHSMASTALDAVVLIDNDGNVSFWNDAAARIFGYTNEEIVGKYLHSYLMPERYIDAFKKGFDTFRITGQGPYVGTVYEIEAKRKDGTEFPVELSLNALRLKGRWNAIGIVRDITERKRAEESLKKTMEELSRSNRELEQFAYAVSHDLQEPLRTVGSYVDLLAEKYKGKKLDEKADRYISYTIEGANRMSTLISDLLAYSRVGTRGRQFASVAMDSVFIKAAENLKRATEEGQAVITSGQLPHVSGDETQLVQLLQNLIGNAVKFRKMDVQPRIHVSAERKGAEWVFGVYDNGIGIEPRFHDRIFTVFQRLHTREEYAGTGIGLAICRRIVERHRGRIWVESKPGEGSVFYFTLPASG